MVTARVTNVLEVQSCAGSQPRWSHIVTPVLGINTVLIMGGATP